MSGFVSFSMYFLSFAPLWITVLFIDIKSFVDGGGNKWTEISCITGILLGMLISAIISDRDGSEERMYVLSVRNM